jgi:hypothetical protein
MRFHRSIRAVTLIALAAAWMVVPAGVAAHAHVPAGDFHLVVGWANEPAYVGQPNGIQVLINDHDDQPVTDLAPDALSVVVSTAGQDSPSFTLSPAFDIEEGFGTPGEYGADMIPTVPGEYNFHFTGTIRDQAVDVSITSGEDTFSSVESSSDAEFPVKVPTLADVATRLDRIDGRIEELQAQVPDAQAIANLQTAANDARAAADSAGRTALFGFLVGGAGLVVAVISLWVAMRAGRRGAGTA